MLLRSLSITNFKNIGDAAMEFSPKVNCLLGNNGMGKSNLLDAIYFLSFCKSFSGMTDTALIRRGESFATLRGEYSRNGLDEEITAGLVPGRRKSFRRNGKEYKRLSEHIGAFPMVMLSPADMQLADGAPDERRRFIDQIISQSDPRYLEALVRYNHALENRNRLLRQESTDSAVFEAIEMQMAAAGTYLCRSRRRSVEALDTIFRRFHNAISGSGEQAAIAYSSRIPDDGISLEEILARNRQRDAIVGHTTAGPHRDDIEMTIDAMPVRRCASQGQTKTFTSALRFAQYELLHKAIGIKPLLLLDDIFDKLDASRVANIMKIVADAEKDAFGQIFITDTNRKHLDEIVSDIPGAEDARTWVVDNGTFTPMP